MKKWLYVLFVFIVLISFGATYSNDDSVDYAVTQMARADSSLFARDFVAVADSSEFTPKIFSDLLVVILMKLGFSWKLASLILYLVAAFILSYGIVELACAISQEYVLATAVFIELAIMYMTIGQDFGQNYIWRTSLTVQTMSMSFIVLALGFALRSQVTFWRVSLLLVAAVLFNVQMGVYTIVIVGVVYWVRHGYRKLIWLLPPLIAAAVMFSVVSMRSESLLSDSQFIEIYAKMRNPHHLITSKWDAKGIAAFFGHTAALFVLAYVVHKHEIKQHIKEWMAMPMVALGLGALLLAVSYLFIEVVPWSFMAKIYPGRFYIILRLICIIYAAKVINAMLQQRQYPWVFLFVLCMLHMPSSLNWLWICCIALGIFMQQRLEQHESTRWLPVGAAFVMVLAFMVSQQFQYWTVASILHLILFVLCAGTEKLSRDAAVMMALCMLTCITMLINEKYIKPGIKTAVLGTTTAAHSMAQYIRDNTSKDTLILCDPIDQAYNDIRLFGERSLVVSWKVVPTSDEALLEWVNRLMDMNCLIKEGEKYIVESGFVVMEPRQVVEIAWKYGADYLVIHRDHMAPYQDYTIIHEQGDYALVLVPAQEGK